MDNYKRMYEILNSLDNLPIYICGHITPDQDSIGSSIALCEYLISKGKCCYVLLRKEDEKEISYQNDYTNIVNQINDKSFNLIILDMNEVKRMGSDYSPYFPNAKLTINIDHHQDNKNECNFTLSDTSASSTCEIIYSILSYEKNFLNNKIASNLYTGILNDTNGFTRRISHKTLSIVQELINYGIDYAYINKETINKRSLYQMKALANLINEIHYDGFHYAIVDKANPTYQNLTHNDIVKQIAEDLRKIEELDTFLLLIKQDNKLVAKVMTKSRNDANQIAELFNGGGHKKEAGFTIYDTPTSTIINKIKHYLKNNQR